MSRVGALRRCIGTGRVLSFGDERARRIIGDVDGVRFAAQREVDHRLGEGELALRAAQALVGLARIERDPQRARVGQADVLDRHAHDAPAEVERIGAAVEHAHQPVERRVGIASRARDLCSAEIWS